MNFNLNMREHLWTVSLKLQQHLLSFLIFLDCLYHNLIDEFIVILLDTGICLLVVVLILKTWRGQHDVSKSATSSLCRVNQSERSDKKISEISAEYGYT